MGGAFVAVADDGSAAFWNPAGVALAPKGHLTVEWVRFQTGDQNLPPLPGPTRRTSSFASFGTSNYGFAFGTFQRAEIVSTNLGLAAENLKVTQYSATVLQGLSQQIIVGSTLKFLRGFSALGPVIGPNWGNGPGERVQLQQRLGGQIRFRYWRPGEPQKSQAWALGEKSARALVPEFGRNCNHPEKARSGAAFPCFPTGGLTLAMDVDLDTVDLRGGLRRMIALGGEDRMGRRFALRGGVRWSVARGPPARGDGGVQRGS